MCICVCMYVYVYIYTYIYIYTYVCAFSYNVSVIAIAWPLVGGTGACQQMDRSQTASMKEKKSGASTRHHMCTVCNACTSAEGWVLSC